MNTARIYSCNADSWTAGNAILFLYFSDRPELTGSSERRRKASEYIESKLTRRVFSASLDGSLLEEIDAKIAVLMKIDSSITSTVKAVPLLWIRFAFQAMLKSIVPAQAFLDWYAIWRWQLAVSKSCKLIVSKSELTHPTSARSTFDYAGKRYDCYPIDYFFLNPIVNAPLSGGTEWVLLSENRKSDELLSQKRTERIVGANAYQEIHDCIERFAAEGVDTKQRISGLLSEKVNGRYLCIKTRAELAKDLKKRIKKLKYSESTIVRVLSEFVACPRHREAKFLK